MFELVAIISVELVVWLVAMTAAEERLGDGSGVLAKYEEVVCSARMLLVEDTAFTSELVGWTRGVEVAAREIVTAATLLEGVTRN